MFAWAIQGLEFSHRREQHPVSYGFHAALHMHPFCSWQELVSHILRAMALDLCAMEIVIHTVLDLASAKTKHETATYQNTCYEDNSHVIKLGSVSCHVKRFQDNCKIVYNSNVPK